MGHTRQHAGTASVHRSHQRTKVRPRARWPFALLAVATVMVVGCSKGNGNASGTNDDRRATSRADARIDVAGAPVAETVSDRFQSYNVEMASVVGGTFWAPRDDPAGQAMSYHPPLEFDERLTNLTKRLGPAYMRVSGSWANKAYFDDSAVAPADPPDGFTSVLTGTRWSEVGRFADATDARIVTSFASGSGTRAADGSWTPDLAERFLRYSTDNDIPVDAAEFINEPNIQGTAGATYDAEGFARDFGTLRSLRDRVAPELRLLGPGGMVVSYEVAKPLDDPTSEELLGTSASLFDDFSYHAYTGMSSRCPNLPQVPVDRLMDRDVLSIPTKSIETSRALRDRFMPDARIWLTETSTAACGGDESAPTFKGAFAYLEHLADAARNGVWVNMYNTLVASDYGLIDDRSHEPRPSYWAAYLWKRLMGDKSLDIGPTNPVDTVSVYGHCTVGGPSGAVTILVSNRNPSGTFTLDLDSRRAEVLSLGAEALDSSTVAVNGTAMTADTDGTFADPEPVNADGTNISVPAHSLAFVTLPEANNKACAG